MQETPILSLTTWYYLSMIFQFKALSLLLIFNENIAPSFGGRGFGTVFGVFKVISWVLQVPAIPCSVVRVLRILL